MFDIPFNLNQFIIRQSFPQIGDNKYIHVRWNISPFRQRERVGRVPLID